MASGISCYLIVVVTLDRCVAIVTPLSVSIWRTTKMAKIIIFSTYVFGILYNLPFLWTIKLNALKSCVSVSATNRFSQIWAWVTLTTNCFFPFTALAIMNGFIIRAVRNRTKFFKKDNDPNETKLEDKKKKKTDEKDKDDASFQLSLQLILVTFAFFFFVTPFYVRSLLFSFVDFSGNPTSLGYATLLYHVSNKMLFTNSAVNILLYCMSGKKFRNDLMSLFRKAPSGGQMSGSSASVATVRSRV